jgi:hypothetical protein
MVRPSKFFTIIAGGTPQPLIGTKTTAAVGPVNQPTGIIGSQGIYVIPVLDASMFLAKDWALIGAPSTGEERLLIMSKSGNNVTVLVPTPSGIVSAYASGAYFRLANAINSTYIQTTQGNTGAIYVGTRDNMVKATGASVIALLYPFAAPTQPTEYRDGRSGLQNADDIGQYWVDGTTGDGYLPSYGAV